MKDNTFWWMENDIGTHKYFDCLDRHNTLRAFLEILPDYKLQSIRFVPHYMGAGLGLIKDRGDDYAHT